MQTGAERDQWVATLRAVRLILERRVATGGGDVSAAGRVVAAVAHSDSD